jgi:hypothetical protein
MDCDGDLDLAVVNGRVMRGRKIYKSDVPDYWKVFVQPNLLFFNDGAGRFRLKNREGGPLTELVENSRALVSGDVDNDGDIDCLVANCGGRARLMINQVPRQGNWLMLRVLDPHLNRDAVGATVRVSAQGRVYQREVSVCSSYLSSNDPRLHVGLAEAKEYDDIIVTWLDGTRERFAGGPANRHVVLNRGEGEPLEEVPGE